MKYKLWEENIPDYQDELGQMPELEVFPVEGAKACILVIPGGGYTWTPYEHEGVEIAEEFNRRGIFAFVLRYRIAPYMYPVPLTDGKRAVRLVRSLASKYGYDESKISVVGFSAGGHLTAMLSTVFEDTYPAGDSIDAYSAIPNLAILSYAVTDYTGRPDAPLVKRMLGENASQKDCEAFSPVCNVKENTPPTFIWHTEEDSLVALFHPLNMAAALFEKKIPCELHIFPTGDHGLGTAANDPYNAKWLDLCEAFMKKYLDF